MQNHLLDIPMYGLVALQHWCLGGIARGVIIGPGYFYVMSQHSYSDLLKALYIHTYIFYVSWYKDCIRLTPYNSSVSCEHIHMITKVKWAMQLLKYK